MKKIINFILVAIVLTAFPCLFSQEISLSAAYSNTLSEDFRSVYPEVNIGAEIFIVPLNFEKIKIFALYSNLKSKGILPISEKESEVNENYFGVGFAFKLLNKKIIENSLGLGVGYMKLSEKNYMGEGSTGTFFIYPFTELKLKICKLKNVSIAPFIRCGYKILQIKNLDNSKNKNLSNISINLGVSIKWR